MTYHLSHHIGYTLSERRGWLESIIEDEIQSIRTYSQKGLSKNAHGLAFSYIGDFYRMFGDMNIVKWPHPRILWCLNTMLDAGLIHYRLAFNPDQLVPCSFDDYHFLYTGKSVDWALSVSAWLPVYSAALIDDNGEAAHELCQLNETHLDMDAGDTGDPDKRFDKAMLNLLKGVINPQADMVTLLKEAAELSAPEHVGYAFRQDYINHTYVPLISLIAAMYSSEREERYPRALIRALEAHKAFYGVEDDEENYAYSSKYWVSLPITALAAIAYRRWGLEPNVESEYLPLWLVKKEFPDKRLPYEDAFSYQPK